MCEGVFPRYKYRLVVDESLALGVLGGKGRGAAEAAGLAPKDVDIISASLSASPFKFLVDCQGTSIATRTLVCPRWSVHEGDSIVSASLSAPVCIA